MMKSGEPGANERRFSGPGERLRAPERLARMEVSRVVALSLEGLAAANVLDVGTGTGVFAEAFAGAGLAATGIDTNAELLELARGYAPGATFRLASAEELPFDDGSFDLVFLGHVLHEAGDPLSALREARRVARQRVAVFEWPYRDEPFGPPLAHRLAPGAVAELAERAGFAHVQHLELAEMSLFLLAAPAGA